MTAATGKSDGDVTSEIQRLVELINSHAQAGETMADIVAMGKGLVVGLTETKMAKLLEPYGVAPRLIKRKHGTFHGYHKVDLVRALALHFPEDDDTPTF